MSTVKPLGPLSEVNKILSELLDRANTLAGKGDDHWNRRYREALIHEGLVLYEYIEPDDGIEAYVFAPWPLPGQCGWRKTAWITFASGGEQCQTQTTICIPTGLPKA